MEIISCYLNDTKILVRLHKLSWTQSDSLDGPAKNYQFSTKTSHDGDVHV